MLWVRANLELTPDRVSIWPELLDHGFVHDGDDLRIRVVGWFKGAPAHHGNFQGLEISRKNYIELTSWCGLIGGWLITFYAKGVNRIDISQRDRARDAGRLHAGKRAHALEQVLVELAVLHIVVTNLVRVHGHIQ